VDDHSLASIAVKGGAGNDSLSVKGAGASGTIRLDRTPAWRSISREERETMPSGVDLGKTDALELVGELRMRLTGGLGNDVLTAMLANTTRKHDGHLRRGRPCWPGQRPGHVPSEQQRGHADVRADRQVQLDGGLGTDILTNNSKPLSNATGFEQVI
jgi:Ca2+-binding RTX toxin-like protein